MPTVFHTYTVDSLFYANTNFSDPFCIKLQEYKTVSAHFFFFRISFSLHLIRNVKYV